MGRIAKNFQLCSNNFPIAFQLALFSLKLLSNQFPIK